MKNKYLRAIVTNFVFFGINTFFFLAITPLAIRVMGEEFYGLFSILIALMLLSNIGASGITAIMMKFSSEITNNEFEVIQRNRITTSGYLVVGVMAFLVTIILIAVKNPVVNQIEMSFQFNQQFQKAIVWVALGIFPQFLAFVPQGYLLGQLHNRSARLISLMSSIALWGGAVLLSVFQKNLIWLGIWVFLLNWLVFFFYLYSLAKFNWKWHWQFHLPTLRRMLNFSGWMFLQSLAIVSFQQLDRVFVGLATGPVAAGAYAIGTSMALRLSLITGEVTQVMTPYASLKDSLGDNRKLFDTYRHLSYFLSLVLALGSSILIVWMSEILTLWISPDFSARYTNPFRILILAYNFLSLSRPAHQTLTGIGRVKLVALIYLILAVCMLSGVFFFSKEFGVIGAAVANLFMAGLLLYNLGIYRLYTDKIPWKELFFDIGWGMFFPLAIYLLMTFYPNIALGGKLVLTLLLEVLFSFLTLKDELIKQRLSFLWRSFLTNRE